MKNKNWVTLKVKAEYSRNGIPEMIGIYYNPYNCPVSQFIKDWILPEERRKVYGFKC